MNNQCVECGDIAYYPGKNLCKDCLKVAIKENLRKEDAENVV